MRELQQFIQVVNNLEKVYRQMPREIGRIAVNFSKERFRAQNWVDNRTEPWKMRRTPGKGKSASRGILIGKGSGYLKKSIRVVTATQNYVKIGTDAPYARTHNEGAVIDVTESMRRYFWAMYYQSNLKEVHWKNMALAKKIKIPRRQFLGESAILTKQLERELLAQTIRALKNK